MAEKLNQAAEVIGSDTRKELMSSKASAKNDEKRNVSITTNKINTSADDINTDYDEKVDFGQDSESDDDEIFVTIGDIETNLPSQRNIHGFSNQYKPPSRTITNYPTPQEIQKQQLTETEIPECKKKTDKRVLIDKTAAEKLPPMIRNIVIRVAESYDNFQPLKIPTVNFSTSASKPSTSFFSTEATASLPAEFNPNIPPPMLPTTTVPETGKKDADGPITPVQALLRKYSVDDGSSKAETQSSYPDKNVREQHQKQLDRNRRGEANKLDDNYRQALSFYTNEKIDFVKTYMNYIFKNFKPEHFIKLNQCCKYFYVKFRRNIIRHLEIVPNGEAETLDPTKTVICVSNHVLSTINDLWLTDSYTNHGGIAVLPELFHCCIKKLELLNGIAWSEYKKLAKAGTIEELNIAECLYFPVEYGYVMYAPVESIIAEVPNAKSIEISNALFTEESCKALLSVNLNVKFSKFVLRNITPQNLFKFQLFKEFILKNADPECYVRIDFKLFDEDDDDDDDAVREHLSELGTQYTEEIISDLKKK